MIFAMIQAVFRILFVRHSTPPPSKKFKIGNGFVLHLMLILGRLGQKCHAKTGKEIGLAPQDYSPMKGLEIGKISYINIFFKIRGRGSFCGHQRKHRKAPKQQYYPYLVKLIGQVKILIISLPSKIDWLGKITNNIPTQ